MSIDFNGTTSKLENTTAAHGITNIITVSAWSFADNQGENLFGRIFVLDEAGTALQLYHNDVANEFTWDVRRSGGVFGQWAFTANDSGWRACSVSYDSSLLANVPVVRVDFAPVTISESVAPNGTALTPGTGYCVGNRSAADRTWDGMLQHVQVFNVILTAGEMDQSLRRPGSVRRGMVLWLPMLHTGDVADLSGNAFNGTATALTDRVGGPPAAPLYCDDQFPGFSALSSPLIRNELCVMGVG